MSKLTLDQQVDRFIKSGFKESRFTNDIYEMLYIDTNVFIAHFDKKGFYYARFLNNAHQTLESLKLVKKTNLKPLCEKLYNALNKIIVMKIIESITYGVKQ